ncbi:hypothetical protein BKA69DRAFT_1052843 [Paraphysoderma sedebokerense]|nr:hypothetical protein BKA69DRAFT_1052843 [Paraphysoderma sedebokerense]
MVQVPTVQQIDPSNPNHIRAIWHIQNLAYAENPSYHESEDSIKKWVSRRGALGLLASLKTQENESIVGYIFGYPIYVNFADLTSSKPPRSPIPSLHKPDYTEEVSVEDVELATKKFDKTGCNVNLPVRKVVFYLHDRAVHPDFQGQKIGSIMFDKFCAAIDEKHWKRCWAVSVNPGEKASETKRGFVHIQDLMAIADGMDLNEWTKIETLVQSAMGPMCYDDGKLMVRRRMEDTDK